MPELVIALDVSGRMQALQLLDSLPDLRWAKVGPVLFVKEGPRIVGELRERGIQVFLDLKWHDIPNTVAGAVRGARELGVEMATVHALGGKEMLAAGVKERGGLDLVAVTVLTSHSPQSYRETVGIEDQGDLGDEVGRLARVAVEGGVQGVVCAASEIGRVRKVLSPGALVVVPGIRPAGSGGGDQRRAARPGLAARRGATHLVVGRPVTEAADPRAMYESIVAEANDQDAG